MGEAARRRRRLGSLYGAPSVSIYQLHKRLHKAAIKGLHPNDPVSQYLSADACRANHFRLRAAEAFVVSSGFYAKLNSLPDSFIAPFLRLLGHSLMPGRETENWDSLASDLVAITTGADNERALASWPEAFNGPIYDEACQPLHACFALLQKFVETLGVANPNYLRLVSCIHPDSSVVDAIPTHISAASAIYSGHLLFQSGKLLLVDTACGRKPADMSDSETLDRLMLVKLRKDGIYANGLLALTGDLLPSDVKAMKTQVLQYQGLPIAGELHWGRPGESARICSAIGLSIYEGYAWIGK